METITQSRCMDRQDTVVINNIPLYDQSFTMAVDHIVESVNLDMPRNYCISLTGAHGIVYAKKNTDFKALLRSFHLNLPDGMPGVWVGKLKGARTMERCYGPSIFAAVMEASADRDLKHFLCGGREGVAEELQRACEKKFNNENIVGTYCPPFLPVEDYDYEDIAGRINDSGTDVVWVGISTPKQEQFAERLSRYTNVHFLITVGAAFDFHIGKVRQAPSIVQKMGMEWLFRVAMEPRRLFRRYVEIVPLFLYYSALDLWNFKFKKKN